MPRPAAHGIRAERTRKAVLDAGEELFAERGFEATRLEDIALRVGIRRASLVYYYPDKRRLYDAVLARVLGDLHARLEEALASEAPLPARIEAAAAPQRRPALAVHTQAFTALVQRHVLDRPEFRRERLAPIDPVHVASTVVGSTVFLVAAMPALLPGGRHEPLGKAQLAAHEEEMLRVVRRLLGY